jgi:membrane-associated phospholipid phosphatase
MFQFGTEFQDVVATGTGFFRMYNDRHWLTDVAAGAGIGILCTKTAWLYPKMQNYFSKETKRQL